MIEPESKSGVNLIWVGVMVEGGLLLFALLLGWFGFHDHQQPITAFEWHPLLNSLQWGLITLIPMLAYLLVFHFWNPPFYQPMSRFIETKLRPMFSSSSYIELLILSLMAGFGEELFFRWCLQGGITSLSESTIGTPMAIGLGLAIASIVFGVCHWVNVTYGVTTTIVGAYLGIAMVWTGDWLVPAIAHALFDFVALLYIVRPRPELSSTDF